MTIKECLKKGIKRMTIASMIIDLGTAENHMYIPVISWYFNFTNLQKPIEIVIKYAWRDMTINYRFSKKTIAVIETNLMAHSIWLLKENYPDYKGKCEITDYYKSTFGKDLPFDKIRCDLLSKKSL